MVWKSRLDSQERVSRVLGSDFWPIGSDPWIKAKVREFHATPEGQAEKKRLAEDALLAEHGYPSRMRAKRRGEALEAIRREGVRRKGMKQAHVKRLHHERLRQAQPAWADREAMRAIYSDAQWLTLRTGKPYEVDHVVPLLGKHVSGLHVEYNLRVVHRTVNRRKSNRI